MPIQHNAEQFEFSYFDEQGEKVGKLCYRYIKDDVIDAFHTKVAESHQGKGIAGELYDALIAFAQEQQLKIKPSCSYIEVKMRRSHQNMII